jgi:tetratricopeptide (TPR) repeat protein
LYDAIGRYAEAAEVYKRLLGVYGGNQPGLFALLGIEYFHLGRVAEGEALFNHALANYEKRHIPNDPWMAEIQEEFAGLYAMMGMTDKALVYSRKATTTLIAIAATNAAGIQASVEPRDIVEKRADLFRHHLAILAAARQKGIEPASALDPEALDIAQWANQSSAALAVQQMSLRFAVEETQKLLRPGEALAFILACDKALTSENFDWQTIPLGKEALSDKVSAFRRGLDVDKLQKSIDASRNS